jgi:hypothetical protein
MAPINKAICSFLLLGLQQTVSALRFSGNGTTLPYKNPNNPVEVRVEDLLGRMTIEDKMAQLMQGTIPFLRFFLWEVNWRRKNQMRVRVMIPC